MVITERRREAEGIGHSNKDLGGIEYYEGRWMEKDSSFEQVSQWEKVWMKGRRLRGLFTKQGGKRESQSNNGWGWKQLLKIFLST